MRIGIKRILGAVGAVVALGLIALFAYRAQVNHVRSAAARGRHSPPILIPGIQEPAEMRVEPIPVAVLTPPERMLGEAMQQAGNKGGRAALLPALRAHGPSDAAGPCSVEQYELNCISRQIRTVSFATYNALGTVVGSHEGGQWAGVVPDTLGESLFDGRCRSN